MYIISNKLQSQHLNIEINKSFQMLNISDGVMVDLINKINVILTKIYIYLLIFVEV